MTGPEHYRAAEDCIDLADNEPEGSSFTPLYIGLAQAHATLALTAASAQEYADRWTGNHEHREWSGAIS